MWIHILPKSGLDDIFTLDCRQSVELSRVDSRVDKSGGVEGVVSVRQCPGWRFGNVEKRCGVPPFWDYGRILSALLFPEGLQFRG